MSRNGRRQGFKITTVRTTPTLEADELISILSTEHPVPYDCVTIVDAPVRAGRNTEATTWSRHGLATSGFPEYYRSDLRSRRSDILIAHGDLKGPRDADGPTSTPNSTKRPAHQG